MRGVSRMGIITKIIKYGAVFAAGYYLASCTCKPYTKLSGLEQEVVKYEQKIGKDQEIRARFFP